MYLTGVILTMDSIKTKNSRMEESIRLDLLDKDKADKDTTNTCSGIHFMPEKKKKCLIFD